MSSRCAQIDDLKQRIKQLSDERDQIKEELATATSSWAKAQSEVMDQMRAKDALRERLDASEQRALKAEEEARTAADRARTAAQHGPADVSEQLRPLQAELLKKTETLKMAKNVRC